MPTYQYGVTVDFRGSLADVHWVEKQIDDLISKARDRGLRVDLETHMGSKKKESGELV